ncbi:hypothetical protein J6590_004254 [Homalodisca vitripennis]|nr:hypothetical protein J6590_004254 [Homalodisca vitripennis]
MGDIGTANFLSLFNLEKSKKLEAISGVVVTRGEAPYEEIHNRSLVTTPMAGFLSLNPVRSPILEDLMGPTDNKPVRSFLVACR